MFCSHIHKVFVKLHSLLVARCSAADKPVGLYEHFRTPRKDLIAAVSATCALLVHHAAEQAKVRSPNAPIKRLQREKTSDVAKGSNFEQCSMVTVIDAQTTVYFILAMEAVANIANRTKIYLTGCCTLVLFLPYALKYVI